MRGGAICPHTSTSSRTPMPKHIHLLYSTALCCIITSVAGAQAASTQAASSQKPPTERVTGIGGFFFKAKDPKALAEWYEKNLGVGRTPTAKGMEPWHQEAGTTAFQPFPATT